MGVCNSSKGTKVVIQEIREDVDFEKAREEIRDKRDENIYEVKAKLYEYTTVNPKLIRKTLISKYLFFNPNGKFTSSVSKNMFSDLLIEGWINPKSMYLTLITKQHLVENNSYTIKTYEGKLNFTEDSCVVKGKVSEDGPNGKVLSKQSHFELDFTTDLWKGSYKDAVNKVVEVRAFISYKDLFYTGVALSDRGLSLIKGLDKSNKCSLIQVYIDSEEHKEKAFYNYVGIKDDIANKFEGTVQSRDLEKDTKVIFELKGRPIRCDSGNV